MDKLLTVVIPSYNVEKFLNQTLDSFVCDEAVMKKFEVIVVDDGSKDNTAKIGKEYADKYPDTFRVISKENGGHGSGINVGSEKGAKFCDVIPLTLNEIFIYEMEGLGYDSSELDK